MSIDLPQFTRRKAESSINLRQVIYFRLNSLEIDSEADICMQEAYCEVDLGVTPVKSGENRMDQREKLNYDPIS